MLNHLYNPLKLDFIILNNYFFIRIFYLLLFLLICSLFIKPVINKMLKTFLQTMNHKIKNINKDKKEQTQKKEIYIPIILKTKKQIKNYRNI